MFTGSWRASRRCATSTRSVARGPRCRASWRRSPTARRPRAADLARPRPPALDPRARPARAVACFPVYRTYAATDAPADDGEPRAADAPREPCAAASSGARSADPRPARLSARDAAYLDRALGEARERTAAGPLTAAAFDFLTRVLHLDPPPELAAELPGWRDFVARWQQLTGPAMAKGLEDTALYVYNRLISLNAVGGEPEGVDRPGDVAAFHRRNAERREHWPYGMTCTSTHDAKRSEDVRARISVLSELAGEWTERIERWTAMNRARKPASPGTWCRTPRRDLPLPDPGRRLAVGRRRGGAFRRAPRGVPGEGGARGQGPHLVARAGRGVARRRCRLHPRPARPSGSNAFLDELLGFVSASPHTAPGVACRRWCSRSPRRGSPTSTRAASCGTCRWSTRTTAARSTGSCAAATSTRWTSAARRLKRAWTAGDGHGDLLAELVAGWRDGRVKQWVTWRGLTLRRRHRDLFLDGDYQPLAASGEHAACVVAFARRHGDRWLLAVATRWLSRVVPPDEPPLGERWGDTAVLLPDGTPGRWTNALDGRRLDAGAGALSLTSVLRHLPVALLTAG